ncbi:hypothetical protein EBF04_17620 [Streptomyces sp. I6]|nr:hypothetical protein EBF04_17620 [Streptomyces sp. I6]
MAHREPSGGGPVPDGQSRPHRVRDVPSHAAAGTGCRTGDRDAIREPIGGRRRPAVSRAVDGAAGPRPGAAKAVGGDGVG